MVVCEQRSGVYVANPQEGFAHLRYKIPRADFVVREQRSAEKRHLQQGMAGS